MLNRNDMSKKPIAKILYLDSDFQVDVPGSHVVCAITGQEIPLDELKYWSWERQEAYVDAHASLKAEQQAGNLK